MNTATEWKAGDRARCISADRHGELRHGRLYLVNRVHASLHGGCLTLAPDVAGFGWMAERFVKVTPRCDKEFFPDPRFFDKLDGNGDGF